MSGAIVARCDNCDTTIRHDDDHSIASIGTTTLYICRDCDKAVGRWMAKHLREREITGDMA